MYEDLIEAIVNMRPKEAMDIARGLIERGEDPIRILESCREAVEAVGDRFQKGEYFLPELMMAGNMLSNISTVVKPKLVGRPRRKRHGRVLMGTVKGDIHDIGKNIVSFLLDANGFEVLDIGIDVQPEIFVERIREFKPEVVGLSGLLTLAYDTMKETVTAIEEAGLRGRVKIMIGGGQAIEEAGLRGRVKIMIGGGQMNDKIREYAGADAYGKDAMAAVVLSKQWMGIE